MSRVKYFAGYSRVLPRLLSIHPPVRMSCPDSLPSRISFSPTRVWGYGVEDTETGSRLACPLWPGVTLENTRNKTVTVKYVNRLPAFNT